MWASSFSTSTILILSSISPNRFLSLSSSISCCLVLLKTEIWVAFRLWDTLWSLLLNLFWTSLSFDRSICYALRNSFSMLSAFSRSLSISSFSALSIDLLSFKSCSMVANCFTTEVSDLWAWVASSVSFTNSFSAFFILSLRTKLACFSFLYLFLCSV